MTTKKQEQQHANQIQLTALTQSKNDDNSIKTTSAWSSRNNEKHMKQLHYSNKSN